MNDTDPANTTDGPAVGARVDRRVRPLVERLRTIAQWETPGAETPKYRPDKQATCNEAAAELERLGDLLGGMDSHGRYWVENRGRIINAVTAAGFQIMSNRDRCWLARTDMGRESALAELYGVVAQILDDGHMNTEYLARLRAAWERA